jgi:hypothetical protein
VAEPCDTPRASPAAETVATPVLVDIHVTELVISRLLLSKYVPVAVNCCVAPAATVDVAGVTAMDASTGAEVTLKDAVPLIDPAPAVMVVVPADTAKAKPEFPGSFVIIAAPVEELQIADAMVCVLLSLKTPVATNLREPPGRAIEALAGVTEIDTSPGGVRLPG